MYRSTLVLTVISFFFCHYSHGQQLDASFQKAYDTIAPGSNKKVSHSFKVTVKGDAALKGTELKIVLDTDHADYSEGSILINRYTVPVLDKDSTYEVMFTVNRNDSLDRKLQYTLKANREGKDVSLKKGTTTYQVYIRPYVDPALSNYKRDTAEFWLFTGTNIDFLDGVKAKDLYFKGSLLTPLDQSKRLFLYLTFGKNRFNGEKDSLGTSAYAYVLSNTIKNDSARAVRESHKLFRTVSTDNIFVSTDFLYDLQLDGPSSLYATFGLYFGLQTIRNTFSDQLTSSDTSRIELRRDSGVILDNPIFDYRYRQANYNASVGFMHILDIRNLNIKTQLIAGVNILNYPFTKDFPRGGFLTRGGIATGNFDDRNNKIFASRTNPFVQLRMDATVLDPGISLGFETFIRRGELPLFNVSLTKVIDFRRIADLFTPLSPLNR